ncbi:MAG TPA: hypothetical protein VFP59_10140 [Candidatus Angelobacter sp.]|nr:hypothetical protein [Candidatus Angelobacter sp.]
MNDSAISIRDVEHDESAVYVLYAASYFARTAKTDLTMEIYLAALYVVAFNRLMPYCRSPESLVDFVAKQYDLLLPVWVYWVSIYEALKDHKGMTMCKTAPEVELLLNEAARTALSHHRTISIHDILATLLQSENEACRKFLAAGFDIERMLEDFGRRF